MILTTQCRTPFGKAYVHIPLPLLVVIFISIPQLIPSEPGYTPFPFTLLIEKRQKNSFTGIMSWPTIEGNAHEFGGGKPTYLVCHSILDSKTKVRGTLSDGKIEFEEYEVIKGVDDVDG